MRYSLIILISLISSVAFGQVDSIFFDKYYWIVNNYPYDLSIFQFDTLKLSPVLKQNLNNEDEYNIKAELVFRPDSTFNFAYDPHFFNAEMEKTIINNLHDTTYIKYDSLMMGWQSKSGKWIFNTSKSNLTLFIDNVEKPMQYVLLRKDEHNYLLIKQKKSY
jgi:hypothetical protein